LQSIWGARTRDRSKHSTVCQIEIWDNLPDLQEIRSEWSRSIDIVFIFKGERDGGT